MVGEQSARRCHTLIKTFLIVKRKREKKEKKRKKGKNKKKIEKKRKDIFRKKVSPNYCIHGNFPNDNKKKIASKISKNSCKFF